MTTLPPSNHVCVSCGLPFRADHVTVTQQCAPCREIGSAFFSVFRSQHRDIEDPPRVQPAVPGEAGHVDAS